MKLKPVYLLAPKPEPRSMPTRRAFLLAGGTFAAGSLIGGACGYTLGVATGSPTETQTGEIELTPSGDADLDELRRLAVKAPIEELCQRATPFLSLRVMSYRDDPILWRGMDRLSHEIVSNPNHSLHRTTIMVVIAQIQAGNPPPELKLTDRIPMLRRRQDEAKRGK